MIFCLVIQAPPPSIKDNIHINLNPKSKNKSPKKRKAGPNVAAKKGGNKKQRTNTKQGGKGKGSPKKGGPKGGTKSSKKPGKNRYLSMSIWTEISISLQLCFALLTSELISNLLKFLSQKKSGNNGKKPKGQSSKKQGGNSNKKGKNKA